MQTYHKIPEKFSRFITKLPEAIVFDWDNTIVNMRSVYQNAIVETLKKLDIFELNLELYSISNKILDHDTDSLLKSINEYNVIFTNQEKSQLVKVLSNIYDNQFFHIDLNFKNNIHSINDFFTSKKPEELWMLPNIDIQHNSFHEYIFYGSPFILHFCNHLQEEFQTIEKMIINHCHEDSLHKIKLFDETITLFELCKNLSIPLFIVSNKDGEKVRKEAKELKIESYFQEIVGALDTSYLKPNIEPVLYALRNHNISLKNCWFIGDSVFDMQTANKMDCLGVAVHPRCMSKDTLNLNETGEIIKTLKSIIKES